MSKKIDHFLLKSEAIFSRIFRNRDERQLVNSIPKCSVLRVGSEKNIMECEKSGNADVKSRDAGAGHFGFTLSGSGVTFFGYLLSIFGVYCCLVKYDCVKLSLL